jgi:Secretion system C-terminal sorting domain
MRKRILLGAILLLTITPADATVLTVDNNTGSSPDFTSLSDAVLAAAAGDTLIVAASATNYGDIVVDRPLTIAGSGWCSAAMSAVNNATIVSDSVRLFGLKIKLLTIDGQDTPGNSVEEILIEHCRLGDGIGGNLGALILVGMNGSDYAIFRNLVFRNNYLYRTPVIAWGNDCLNSNVLLDTLAFLNNIWDHPGFHFRPSAQGLETLILDHNQFTGLYPYPNGMFYTECLFTPFSVPGALVKNNLFHGADPGGGDSCQFLNNLSYLNSAYAPIPNTPGPNIEESDPMYVNFTGGAFDESFDYSTLTGSPCHNAASDGTDIGVYGGNHPWPGCSALFPLWNCPLQQANFGDPCLDSLANTQTVIDSACNCVVVNTSIGTRVSGDPVLSIHPNPAHDVVTFTPPYDTRTGQVTILDVLGRVHEYSVTNKVGTIAMSITDLPPGAYFVTLQGEQWQAHGRFIKE